MIHFLYVLLSILAGVAMLTSLIALRRAAILRRLHAAILTLLKGGEASAVQRSIEDAEPILADFDQLAAVVAEQRRELESPSAAGDMEVVLERMIAVLRQPLVAIQSYAALLTQAPDVPASGDTHDLIRKLASQANGLLRLVESSTDMSQLREGLERELAMVLPGKPTPVVLVIDEESPWTQAVTEALRPRRLQVLVAPGTDAALIMARAVRPRAVLVNIGRRDGLGWKTLPGLKLDRGLVHAPVFAYRLSPDHKHGAMWNPSDVWFWPVPNNDDSRIVRNSIKSDNLRYSLHGEIELASEVSRWLAAGGILIEPTDHPPPFLIDGCATLVLSDAAGSTPEEEAFVLIVPQRLIPGEVERLIHSVERQAEKSTRDLADLERMLLERLWPGAEALAEAQTNL